VTYFLLQACLGYTSTMVACCTLYRNGALYEAAVNSLYVTHGLAVIFCPSTSVMLTLQTKPFGPRSECSAWLDWLYYKFDKTNNILYYWHLANSQNTPSWLRSQLPMQSVSITTNVVISNLAHGEVYLIQQYVIKFVSDLHQVGAFPLVLLFPLSIKRSTTI